MPTGTLPTPVPGINDAATNSKKSAKVNISLITYNCKGYKQSADYILNNLACGDVVCLTETWLKPGELKLINESIKKFPGTATSQYNIYSKSSMVETDASYGGRPFGGMAMICRVLN